MFGRLDFRRALIAVIAIMTFLAAMSSAR